MNARRDCCVPKCDTTDLIDAAVALNDEQIAGDELSALPFHLRDADLFHGIEPNLIGIDIRYTEDGT